MTWYLCEHCFGPAIDVSETYCNIYGEPVCFKCENRLIETEVYNCPIHGELGGIDECPKC